MTVTPVGKTPTCLTRDEARERLRRLPPGTEEHTHLQGALTRREGVVTIDLTKGPYKVFTGKAKLLGGFGSSEHKFIGNKVKLQGISDDIVMVKGAAKVTFGHMIALAGDFYAKPGAAISLPGGTNEEKTQRFIQAFKTLEDADNNQVRKVIQEIDDEADAVEHSALPHHCYSSQMMSKNNAIKKIKPDINKLLKDNSDHFSENARDAYSIGHAYALEIAREAGRRNDLEGLKKAYAYDGFACHFLTDLFAAGHIRNERGALETYFTSILHISPKMAKSYAGLLTAAQHEKDGNGGLNVANQQGDYWRAYGDGRFFSSNNEDNKRRAIIATQQSADEIYQAYLNPDAQKPSTVDQLIPFATPLNPPPLYFFEEGVLVLNCGSEKISIQSQTAYLNKGVAHALRNLPEEYISGYLNLFQIETHPIIDKVIFPQVERLMGFVWHIAGLASYHQVKEVGQQLNAKIDEAAALLNSTYNKTCEILKKIENIQSQLNPISWDTLYREIQPALSNIKDVTFEKSAHEILSKKRANQIEEKLRDAYVRLLRVFSEITGGEGRMLEAYKIMLLQTTTEPLDATEVKIKSTLWYREMVDYQTTSFSLYLTLQAWKESKKSQIPTLIKEFQESLQKQIEINLKQIDEALFFESVEFIQLELPKQKTRKIAQSLLN